MIQIFCIEIVLRRKSYTFHKIFWSAVNICHFEYPLSQTFTVSSFFFSPLSICRNLPHEYVCYLKLINFERSLAISNLYFRPFSTFLSSDWIFPQKYLSNGDVLLSYRILFSKKGTLGVLSVMSVKQKAEVGSRSKCKVLIDLRKGLSNMESPRTWSQRGQKKERNCTAFEKSAWRIELKSRMKLPWSQW